MPIRVKLGSAFKNLAQGEMSIQAKSIRELVDRMEEKHPGVRGRILDHSGSQHRFVVIYRNKRDIRSLQGLDTPLNDSDQVTILQALSGG